MKINDPDARRPILCALILLAVVLLPTPAMAQWYLRSLPEQSILEIRGETADTTRLGSDRYVEDNLDYVLKHHEWVAVNFSAYWCSDSREFLPAYQRAAVVPAYAGIRWCYAEVDGTRGNESFRERFALPGVPVVVLFHNAEIATAADGSQAILDGHEGDKTFDDLIALLKRYYHPHPDSSDVSEQSPE